MINFFFFFPPPRFTTDADDTIIHDVRGISYKDVEGGDEFLLFFLRFLSVVVGFLKVGYAFA